jgi:hypothetical protein
MPNKSRKQKGRKWRAFAAAIKQKQKQLLALLFFFNRPFLARSFGRFVTRGVQKRD